MIQKLPRRTVLRGMGVMMALPLLEAMAPLTTRAAEAIDAAVGIKPKFPVRLGVLYMPNGVNATAWTPEKTGADFELSPTLQPLADFKDQLFIPTELFNRGSIGGDGHYVKTSGFLTGTTITKTTGANLRSGNTSMDQLAAQHIGRETALASLELGIDPVTTGVDTNVGYTRVYGSHIAWSSPTTPIAKEINPRLAFDRIFRPQSSGASAEDDRSVLDLVGDDAQSLRSKVGKNDREKLDNYLESVRSIEKRIDFNTKERAERNKMSAAQLQSIEALDKRLQLWERIPTNLKPVRIQQAGDFTEHVRLMLDLMVMSYWCDMTRVSTFMFGNAVSPRNFSFLEGVKGGHHEISHHKNDPEQLRQYQVINRWHVTQFAYMLEKMNQIQEGEGTLLDHSMILFGAGMRDGNSHNPRNLPLVLAGRAGGTLKTGRHVQYKKDTPLCNLYVSMLERMGAPVDHFGDSTEALRSMGSDEFGVEPA
ncbi:MAG TPA: DUF1552 domain-containing protein [Humisphaera sp.]|jgi:hypothetical protein|nr:DUF1552 domain-containing protein [Humisphaera sp.]